MRTRVSCDITETDLFTESSSLELESLGIDVGQEEQSVGRSDDNRPSADVRDSSSLDGSVGDRSPTAVAVVRAVSPDETRLSSPVHRQSGLQGDTTDGRKVGVAARFVSAATVSTPRPRGTKSSDTAERQSSHRGPRSSQTTHQEPSTCSSSSSSSSESVPDGYSRVARCLHPEHTSERDVQRLVSNCRQLNDSQFYVAELSSTDAKRRLRSCPPGTFLVRDSAHPRHLYSLTVRTQRGVTSIRAVYDVHGFRLDSDPEQVGSTASINLSRVYTRYM